MSKLILFQGDSVTDAGRSREHDRFMGSGYSTLIAARLSYEKPGVYRFLNRGVGGNRVVDLYARWKLDCINYAPDAVSILIGVNDVWHELSHQNGVEAERFERVYDLLLSYTKTTLPNARILLLEPFVLDGSVTHDALDYYKKEVALRAAAVRRLTQKFGASFVPLQARFEEALTRAPADFWLRDGVHPTEAGHQLIAENWLRVFGEGEIE